jgi:type III secretory pathway component EscV
MSDQYGTPSDKVKTLGRNISVEVAEGDISPLIAMLMIMIDLHIIKGFPKQVHIASFAWNHGRVKGKHVK